MNNKILTALDIDNNRKSIDLQLEEAIKNFNRPRIRKKLKEFRENLKLESNNIETEIPKEIIKLIKDEIFSDDETKNFIEKQQQQIKTKTDNYFVLRQTLQDLNELNEFSAEVERNNYQQQTHFLQYHELLNHCSKTINFFINILKIRKQNINDYLNKFKNKKLNYDNIDELSMLLKIREFYSIDKSYDDIDIYESFFILLLNYVKYKYFKKVLYIIYQTDMRFNYLIKSVLEKVDLSISVE